MVITMSITPTFKQLKNRARLMRKKQTPEELKLWNGLLKNYLPKFHRQHIIDPYIVDFYCPKLKYIIEVDGSQHYYNDKALKSDDARTQYIEKKGFAVLRISNEDIKHDFRNTTFYIDAMCRQRAKELMLDIDFDTKKPE